MKRQQSGQVLVILLGSVLMGGSGLAAGVFLTGKTASEMRKDALRIVEEERRDDIKALFKRWEQGAKRINKARSENMDELIELARRHDTSPADFDPIFTRFDELEAQAFDGALAMRFELRAQLSAEDWNQLFPSTAP